MLCARCKKEIPAKDQKYLEWHGRKIPKPCDKCVVEIQRENEEYIDRWRESNRKRKK
jgi:hypothetical protein